MNIIASLQLETRHGYPDVDGRLSLEGLSGSNRCVLFWLLYGTHWLAGYQIGNVGENNGLYSSKPCKGGI